MDVVGSWFAQDIPQRMMMSSNGNIFRVTGPLCGEFTGHRWISLTKASDAELWCSLICALNKRLSKQSWGWWFETPSCSLWRHCNGFQPRENISFSQIPQCTCPISHSTLFRTEMCPYPIIHHSEWKCEHFRSECCTVGYGTGASLDLRNWCMEIHIFSSTN